MILAYRFAIGTLFVSSLSTCHAFLLVCPFKNKWNPARLRGRVLAGLSSFNTTEIPIPPYLDGNDNKDYPSVLHSIYVKPVLTDEETRQLLQLARQYAEETGRWQQPDSERHATYATCDFPVDQASSVEAFLLNIDFDDRIFGTFSDFYDIPTRDLSYLDLFCAQYRAKVSSSSSSSSSSPTPSGEDAGMDRLEAHRDGSLLSFTITLSDPDDFEGGGTFFEALRGHENQYDKDIVKAGGVVRPTRAGDGVFHCGKPLHGADIVTIGERVVLVGFVDVNIWRQREGILAEACRTWGRMDVAEKRCQRQVEKTQANNDEQGKTAAKGWFFAKNRSKWLPGNKADSGRGRSYISNYSPAFPAVARRADPNYQRLQRLKAEDRLLRSILLSQEEIDEKTAEFSGSGEITIL